jgi:ABC-type uncharacterized transport system permease subunit
MPGYVLLLIELLVIAGIVVYVVLACKKAKKNHSTNWIMKLWAKNQTRAIAASLLSILLGLFIGSFILFLLANHKIGGTNISFKAGFDAIQLIFSGVFSTGLKNGQVMYGYNGLNVGNVLFNATPLILVGLSVAIAFKTGLFNIGAPGQYLMSTAATLIVALSIPTSVVPSFFVWILAFLAGILAGALWGAIPGLFKAFLNVNEVITCIMCNWIAANLVTALFDKTTGPFKYLLDPSSTKNWAYVFKTSHNNVVTAKLGLDVLFKGSPVNAGIIIAIIIAILIFYILNKTTFGYELRACGSNRDAAKYAGIKARRSIVLSMAIAGALAGAGAALYYLAGNTEFHWETYQSLPAIGFNGIPVSLLAFNNPIGVIFAAIFMASLDVCGMQIKNFTTYNEYITNIISAIIVYFSAFSLVIQQMLSGNVKWFKKKPKKEKPLLASVTDQSIKVNQALPNEPKETLEEGGK